MRRRLLDLGVTSVNRLLRTYSVAVLFEAAEDFERALNAGERIRSRSGFFRSLLK